ncbi:acylphosphatase [Candidatus Micrarchaeota archaeon]|nr:acylphosphatase [Candidatus Micrarchaeota archaeon]
MNARIRIFVYGDVQGVFFRSNSVSEANGLGLSGWVRNRSDGSVEIVAEGEKEKLEELLSWCRKGPGAARVDEVKYGWEKPAGEFSGFSARPTV